MLQQLFVTPVQIPDDIARLAHEQKLGTPQGDYTILKLARGWRWFNPIVLTLLCVMLILIVLTFFFLLQGDSETSLNMSSSLLVSIGLCQALCTGYMTFFAFFYKNYHLYPCNEGFILKESKKKFRTIHWTEIEHIWRAAAYTPKSFFTRNRLYKIQCHDGYTLTFSGPVPALSEIDRIINKHFTQRCLPTYLADYKAGCPLSFGPLTISLNGISVRDNMPAWEQIEDISLLKDRRLVISKAGDQQKPWFTISAFNVPNLLILLNVVEQVRTGRPLQAQSDQPLEPTIALEPVQPALPPSRSMSRLAQVMYRMNRLPDDISALAAEHGLGERQRDGKFGANRVVTWLTIAFQSVGFGISGGIVFGMFSLIGITRIDPFDPLSMLLSLFFTIGFPLLLVIISLLFFIIEIPHIYRYTYTFERGLILKYGRKAPAICRWDDIEAIWHRYNSWTSHPEHVSAHTIQLRDGSKYTLSRLDIDQPAFGQILREQVTPLQLSTITAAYQAGQTLPFGPLRVSQEGIAMGEQVLPWAQVKSVGLEANRLVIYDIMQRKPWSKLAAAQVPNLYVLFALADDVREHAISPDN